MRIFVGQADGQKKGEKSAGWSMIVKALNRQGKANKYSNSSFAIITVVGPGVVNFDVKFWINYVVQACSWCSKKEIMIRLRYRLTP